MNTEATLCQSHSFLLQLFPECRSGDARRPSMVAAKDSGIFNLEGEMWDTRLGKAAAGGWILSSLAVTKAPVKSRSLVKLALWIAIAMIVAITFLGGCANECWAQPITTECSFYTVASTIREGTGSGIGLTASGEILKDEGEYTAAHPTLPFGTRVRLTCIGRKDLPSIVVRINDRGPAAYLRKLGRQIDTNKSAARALGILEIGVAQVMAEVI